MPRQGLQSGLRPGSALLCLSLAAVVLTAGACGRPSAPPGRATPATPAPASMPPGPSCVKPENGSGCLQIAPAGRRIDLVRPSFSNPTSITNPTHPSSRVEQVIYGGQVEGEPF